MLEIKWNMKELSNMLDLTSKFHPIDELLHLIQGICRSNKQKKITKETRWLKKG